jgi:tripartite ATP-independent transporter DctP family solute receptor
MNACYKTILGTVLLASSITSATLAWAQEVKERTIKFALANNIESAHGLGAKRFAEIVSQKSGGKLKINVFASGQLGGEAVVATSMQSGIIEMSAMGPGLLSGMDKDFGVFDTPFLFSTTKEVDTVLDGPVGQKLLEKLPQTKLVGLSYWDHGFRILTNNKKPIAKMEDLQGLKIRVQQIPVFLETFSALGALAVPMPFTELFTALETKAVDGQENPFISVQVTKFYEVQKYASNTRHAYSPLLVLASKAFWDQLSDDERKILLDAANETKPYQREVSRSLDQKAVDVLKKEGMTITEISPEERNRMREKLKPVIEKHQKTVNETLVRELNEEIQKVRASN